MEAAPKKDKKKAHILSDDEDDDNAPPPEPAPEEGTAAAIVPDISSDEEADEAIRKQAREGSEYVFISIIPDSLSNTHLFFSESFFLLMGVQHPTSQIWK